MTPQDDDEAAEPVALDQDDHDDVTATRPLPELDLADQKRASPDQLPTIGHVGRYALKSCIGEGGLGTVYAAHDPLLSRLIAIKTMQVSLPEADREQFNALFMNEAKAAGSLNHPHIVTLYDAGVGAQGAYIAMELLRGKDLRQLLAIGWRPTPSQAALIVRRVADALSYAHHKGVIHRDIKPANIFMVGRTQPRVLDFGIARIRQVGSEASNDGLSRFGDFVGGSPYYMAPEQIRREPVDRRVDVYALGVILYELLAGRRAFGGNDLDEIQHGVLTKTPRLAHEVNPEVPKVLAEIAARAMSRDLVQRTRSARVLSQELREWLEGQSDFKGGNKSGNPAKASEAGAGKAASGDGPTGASASAAKSEQPRGVNRVVAVAGVVSLALLGAGGWLAWQQWGAPTSQVAQVPVSEAVKAPVTAAVTAPVVPPAVPVSPPVVADVGVAAPASVVVAAPVETAAPAAVPAPAPQPLPPAAVVATSPAAVVAAPAPLAVAPVAAAPVAPPVVAKPLPTGTVKLAISPWGRVFVGRKAMGVTPPLNQLTLPQGKHVITIRNDDFPPYSRTVEVKPGQPVSVSHAF